MIYSRIPISVFNLLTLTIVAYGTAVSATGAELPVAKALAGSGLQANVFRSFQVSSPASSNRYVRHAASLVSTASVDENSSDQLKKEASWKIVAGLADAACYSLQSVRFPNDYMRHAGYRIRKDSNDGSALFKSDATWCAKDGLSGVGVSFESKNYPTYYLRQYNNQLWIATKGGSRSTDNARNFEQNVSWNIVNAWSGGDTSPPPPPPPPPPVGSRKLPPVQAAWSYNIGGSSLINSGQTPSGAVISLDLYDVETSAIARLKSAGKYIICYYSAGTSENYRNDTQSQRLLAPALNLGEVKTGNGGVWEGERWLDIRGFASVSSSTASANADVIRTVMSARMDIAKGKGCDAVEPDNVDAWANDVSQKAPPGTAADAISALAQLNYNRWTADAAHARGLSVLLKNDLDQAAALAPYYDGALNEECLDLNECGLLTPFRDHGKAIYVVEYQNASFATAARKNTANELHLNVIITDVSVGRLEPITRFGSW